MQQEAVGAIGIPMTDQLCDASRRQGKQPNIPEGPAGLAAATPEIRRDRAVLQTWFAQNCTQFKCRQGAKAFWSF